MSMQAHQAMERDELLKHRREGGLWLRAMREQAGLSQRELATAVGAEYYSFVSQLESGKGRVPVAQVELWAKALKVPRSVFARGLLRYYDPITYDMLFGDDEADAPKGEAPTVTSPIAAPHAAEVDEELRARVNRLEAILMLRGATS